MGTSYKTKNHSLGRAIIKDKFKGKSTKSNSYRHTTELEDGLNWNSINFKSVTEENTLNEFLTSAELAGAEFTAERINVTLVTEANCIPTKLEMQEKKKFQDENMQFLKIPRRPQWDSSTTPEELDSLERQAFLEWRRSLASLSEREGIILTPYEKNLEFWRQLWRVIEKSNVVVQIVDARNPLFFYCQDLNAYVNEMNKGKTNILLVNKADFLTDKQRQYWANYFTSLRMKIIFWSATNEIQEVQTDLDASEEPEASSEIVSQEFVNSSHIASVDELIAIFRKFKKPEDLIFTVGLIGYPNVGKSSTINTLLARRVPLNEIADKSKLYQTSVSTTPGKTKHFQTFYLDKDLMLCDCPGLVMPMFVNVKAEMITNGILSIDHMNDFVPPITIVCRCIPREVLEVFYSVMLPLPAEGEDPNRHPNAYELLTAYAKIRGFMTHKGVPDYQRAARIILKDFVHGRLNFCYAPPSVSEEEYESAPTVAIVNKLKNKPVVEEKLTCSTKPQFTNELDEEFFKDMNVGFVLKGDLASIGLNHLTAAAAAPLSDRPSKKHFKSNKREKSRRINSHFDA